MVRAILKGTTMPAQHPQSVPSYFLNSLFYNRQGDDGHRTHHLPHTKIIYYANEVQVLANK